MKSLMEIIKARKSIRAYRDEPLPQETIDTILEAGQHAPSARNLQPLEYKVITNKDLISRLSQSITKALEKDTNAPPPPRGLSPQRGFFYDAPLLIIITAPADNHFAMADGSLAAQNMMLCAASLELGSCFIGMARFIKKSPEMCREINIADNMDIVATIICGYPAEDPEPKEKHLKAEYFQ